MAGRKNLQSESRLMKAFRRTIYFDTDGDEDFMIQRR
jgi:hypothetical protein